MKQLLLTFSCVILLLCQNLYAQSISNYAYTTGSDASLARTDGSLIDDINMSVGTTILLFGSQANTQSTLQNIGFDFFVNGTRQTTFNVTTNGWVGIGTTAIPSNTWLGTTGIRLAPFLGSTTTSMAPSAIGRVHYKVFGTAPSRVCVIEFLRMSINSSVLDDTTTFQVRMYESNGEIEFVYGRMAVTAGAPLSFNVGMQFSPTVFQSVNVTSHTSSTSISTFNTFSSNGYITSMNSFANGIRRYYRWIPNPPNDPTNFMVSAVTKNTMSLSWTDASNEIGYVLYRSTDGLTYTFVSTFAANAIFTTQVNLTPSTTYYWRLYPIRESIGTSQDAVQTTLAGGIITSITSGVWNSSATWDGGLIPTLSDSVEIATGHTVTLATGAQAGAVEVSGTLLYPVSTSAQLTVNGNVQVNASGNFNAGTGFLTNHTLNIGNAATNNVSANLIVNGQFDMATNANVAITFGGLLDAVVSGSGSVCDFANLSVNKGTTNVPMLDIVRPITMLAATTTSRLTLNAGTFRLSSASTITPYPGSTGFTICNLNAKLWVNHASAQILTTSASGGTFYQFIGEIRMDAGILSIGTGAFSGFSNTTSIVRLNGGTLNIGGSFQLTAAATSSLIMNGGNLVLDPQGLASLASGTMIFNIPSASTLEWNSGNITIVDPHSTSGGTAVFIAAGGIKSFNGGKLILGGASSSISGGGNTSGFGLNITVPIHNIELNNNITGSNTRMVRLLADLTVTNLLDLKAASYLFLGSGNVERTLYLQGNIVNNGVLSGTEPAGTQILGSTAFTGVSGIQTFSGAGSTTNCNTLVVNNPTGGVQFTNTSTMAFWKTNLLSGTMNPGSNLAIGLSGRNPVVQIGGVDETLAAGSFTSVPTYVGVPSFIYGPTSSACSIGAFNEVAAGTGTFISLTINDAQGLTSARNLNLTNLTLNGGNFVMGSNALTIGTSSTNAGTLVRNFGMISISGVFTRWYATGSTPSGTDSNGFPILNSINDRRVLISSSGPLTAGGFISVQHNNVSGNTDLIPGFTDGGLAIDIRTNSNWIFNTSGINLGANILSVKLSAQGIGAVASAADLRMIRAADGTNGTSVNGSGTSVLPQVNRDFSAGQLSLGQLNDTFYVGTNVTINPLSPVIIAVTDGSWGDSTTWSNYDMPNASNSVFIPSGYTINIPTGTAFSCNDLTVSAGATLQVNNNTLNVAGTLFLNGTAAVGGGTLSVTGVAASGIIIAATTGVMNVSSGTVNLGASGGSNRTLNNLGVVNISGGTVNVNGNMIVAAGSQFVQSGGFLNIDGNSGTAASSVASGTHLLSINTNNVNCSGGMITIIDPPHSSYSTNSTMSIRITASASLSCFTGGHTIRLGDGISTQAGNTNGFVIDNKRSGVVPLRHIEVNGGSTTGRWASPSFNSGSFGLFFTGNLTITSGSELRHNVSSQLAIGGNIINNGTMTSAWPLTLGGNGYNIINNQDISGSGVFRNNTGTSTGSFTSVTLNNGTGVTLSTTGQTFTFTGILSLGTVNITTNSNSLVIATAGSVTRTTGYIIGKIGMGIGTGNSITKTFHLGSATDYLPVVITFPSVTTEGVFTAQLNSGDVPAIATSCFNSAKTINRNWQFLSTVAPGLFNATVNYLASDTDAAVNYSNMRAQVYNGTAWSGNYAANAGVSSATMSGISTAGDLQIGEFQPVPLSVSITSADTSNCAGNPGVFTATATNGGATPVYQWKKNGINVGTNSNTYSVASLLGGDLITCEVTSSILCALPTLATSNTITIKFQTVKGTVSSAGSPICAGTSGPTLSLTGNTGSVLRWEKAIAPYTSWTTIANNTSDQSTGVLTVSTAFRAVVQNSSCSILKTDSVIVTVVPLVVKGAVNGGTNICAGSNSGVLTLTGQTGSVIRWERANAPYTSWVTISNIATTYTATAVSQNTAFRAVVQSGSCGIANSDSTVVTITPLVVKGAVTGGTTICSGTVSGPLTLAGHTGTILRWERANAPYTSWTTIANTITTYTSPTLTQNTAFRAVVQSGACGVANSDSTIVTVTPLVVKGSVTGGATVCSGSTSGLLTLGGQTGSVVRWERANAPYTSWTTIVNTATTYTSTALTQNTAFRAVVQSGACGVANSDSTIVTVTPLVVKGAVSGGSTICNGATSTLLTLSGQTGAVIRWEKAVSPFTSWTTIANTATTYTSTTLTQTTAFRSVVQSGACGVANSDSTVVTVTPLPFGGSVSGGSAICLGATSGTLTLAGQVGTVIRWESAVAPYTSWTTIANTNTNYVSGPLMQNTAFRAVVQTGICTTANSDSTIVSITQLVVNGSMLGGSNICAGATSGTLSLIGQTGSIVRWESSPVPFMSWTAIANTNTSYTSGPLTQTMAFRAVVQIGTCGIANSDSTVVTVTPNVVKGAVSGGSTICPGSSSGVLTLSGQTGSLLRWEIATAPFTSWTAISNTNTTYTSGALTQTTAFRAVVQSGSCGIANSDSTIVTVTPFVVKGLVSGGSTICYNTPSALLSLSGQTGTVIRWEKSVAPFSSWTTIVNTNTSYTSGSLTQTTAFRAVVQSGACGIANSDSAIVTVTPLVTGGAVNGGSSICSGTTSGTLTLSGNNGSVIRWESAVAPYTSWTTINNTNPTYISGTLTQSTAFRAVVQLGTCGTAISDSTVVAIIPIATGGSVSGGSTICTGSSSALLSLAGNTGSVVRWEKAVSPFTSWTGITHTGTNYTAPALMQTTAFRAIVQQGTGCTEVNSASTMVTINVPATKGAVNGTSNICTGLTAALTLSNHVGTIVRWESAVAPYTSWTNISNTTTGYTTPVLTASTAYRAVIASGVCPNVNSDSFIVMVAPVSIGGTISGASPICSGSSSGPLTVIGQTGKVIRWESAVSPFTSWTTIADTNNSYSSGSLTITTAFRAIIQSGTCSSIHSDSAMVNVTSGTVGGTITGAAPICMGATAAGLTITSLAGTVDRWESSVAPFTSWTTISNTTTSYSPGAITQTTQFRAIVSSGTCASGSLTPVTIAVSPTTVKGAVTGGTSICSGSVSNNLLLAGQIGAVVRWEKALAPFTTWTTIANTNTNYTSPALTQTTAFRAVVQSGACLMANSDSTVVTVSPLTVAGTVNGTSPVCVGTAAALTLAAHTGSVQRWESAVAPFTSWTTITNTNTVYNSSALAQTTAFRAIVQSGTCNAANTDSIVITATPLVVKGAVSGGATVCSGSTSGLLTLNGQTGTVVRWESAVAPYTSWTTIANTNATYTSVALTQHTAFRAVVQSGSCGTANSDSTIVTVTPLVVKGAVTGGTTICAGSTSGTLTLSGQTGSILRWESAPAPFVSWTPVTNTNTIYTSNALTQTTAFRAVVQSGNCGIANSDSTVVTVTPLVVKGSVSGNTPVCINTSSGLTLTGHTGSVVRWESSVSPYTSWTTIANTNAALTSSNLAQNTAFRAVVQSGSCGIVNTDSFIVNIISNGKWLGGISNAWNTAGNWCGGVPVSTSDVLITAGTPNSPLINTQTTVNNIQIGAGAALGFTGINGSIDIRGTITESGTFTKTGGKVIFGGTVDQTIPGGVYGKLEIAGGSFKTLAGNTTIIDSLMFQNGKLLLVANNLTISNSGVIAGGSATSYVVTNGAGKLTQSNMGTGGRSGNILFPVGAGVASYSPVTIQNNGTVDNFSVRVITGAYPTYTGETPSGTAYASGVVNKTWFISESVAGGSSANITFGWAGADENTINRTSMTVARYNAPWASIRGLGAAAGVNPYDFTVNGVSTLGIFGLGDISSPLPVTMVSFEATRNRNDVLLNWATAQETDNSHFEIERSYTGKNFESIGKVTGNGTSNTLHQYQYEDKDGMLLQTKAYYRLKQVDFDGKTTYTKTVTVSNQQKAAKQTLQVQPNPFDQAFSITFSSASEHPITIELVDGLGRIIHSQHVDAIIGDQSVEFNESGLKAGIYSVRLLQQDEEVKTIRVLKQ